MAIQTQRKAYSASIYASPGPAYGATVVVRAQTLAPYGSSLVAFGSQFSTRRITAVGALTDRLQNRFFGVSESDQITLSLDNRDGELTSLLTEEVRGKPVRIRCYDEGTGDDLVIYDGVIEAAPVLDTVDLSLSRTNLSASTKQLPATRLVESTLGLVETTAADTGVLVPILFGRVQGVPIPLVRNDDVLSEYDYLVGEGEIWINAVYKDGARAWTGFASVVAVTPPTAGTPPMLTVGFSARDFANIDLTGLVLSVYDGLAMGRELKITDVVRQTLDLYGTTLYAVVSVDGDVSGILAYSTHVVVQEHIRVLTGGKTYIRFFHSQIRDGARMNLRADVAKYTRPKKNRLLDTEMNDSKRFGENRANNWGAIGALTRIDAAAARTLAPDAVSNVAEYKSLSGADYIQQTCGINTEQLSDGHSWTVSLWLKKHTLTILRLSLSSDGVGATPTTVDITVPDDWQRFSLTKTTGWGTGATQITVKIDRAASGIGSSGYFWGAQLEYGATPTSYEPVDLVIQGARAWTVPDAIREILSSPYGLNQPIDLPSFEKANEILAVGTSASDWMFLKAQGRIPYLDSTEAIPAKEILDELCQLRGLRLTAGSGAWKIAVDAPGVPVAAVFGNEETPYRNIVEVQPLKRQPSTEVVQSVQVQYGQESSVDGGNLIFFYPYTMEKTGLAATGVPKTLPLRFVRDHHTADRFLQYYAAWMQLMDSTLSIRVGIAGRLLVAGDVLDVHVPRFQPENRLKASEDFGDLTAWTYTAHATGMGGQALSPDRRSYRASRVTFAPGWTGQSVTQTTSIAPTNRLVSFTCWVRADAPVDGLEIRLESNTEIFTTPITIGVAWKKVHILHVFGNAATSPCTARIANTSAFSTTTAVYLFGAQLAVDYPRPYARTTTTAFLSQSRFLVTTLTRESLTVSALDLIAYDEDKLFAYAQSVFPLRVDPTVSIDTRATPPLPPYALTIAATGVDTSAGVINSWARVQFIMPSDATGVLLEYQKTDEFGWTMATSVPSADAAPYTVAQAVIYNLVPAATYTVRAIAYNAFNNYSTSTLAVFTAA